MGGNEDLYKGMQMFSEGLKQYNVSQAVNDARDKLTQLNGQEMDKQARMTAMSAASNDLALRLTGAGADAAHIQVATQNLAPSTNAQFQAGENRDLQKQSEKFQSGESSLGRAQQTKIERMKIDAMTGKLGMKAYENAAKDFATRRPEVTDVLKHYQGISDTLDELKQGAKKPESVMFSTLAKIGMLKNANGGRPSQQEFAAMGDSAAWYDKIRREMGIQTENALPEDKQKFWVDILQRAKGRMSNTLGKAIDAHAKGEADMNNFIERDKLQKSLRDKYSNILDSNPVNPVADQVSKVKAWLASPDAQKDPARTQRAQDWLKQQGGG